MRELLMRWSRLEPERCSVMAPDSPSAWVRLGGREHRVGTRDSTRDASGVELAVLLAAVIEAIEARGWYWACTSIGGSTLRAYRVAVDHTVHHGDYDAPLTMMLLGAYLAALEAEAKA